jgi:hypothetical protein
MGARNRVGIGLSYRPARIHRLVETNPWTIPGFHKSSKIPSQVPGFIAGILNPCYQSMASFVHGTYTPVINQIRAMF